MPQNGWACRCTVIQHDELDITGIHETKVKTKGIKKDFKKDGTFDYNAGQTEYIFKESGKNKHDYFKVPREFEPELKNNFGFPSVDEITGRYI
jgi:hypothetical protein